MAVESFDPAFLRAVGGGGGVFRAIFITLVVLNLVASFQAFGTLLAIGPMLLPAAAARCWTQKVWPMIALATIIGMAAALAGLLISYYANLPSGPAIVISAGLIYGISLLAAGRMRFKPRIFEGTAMKRDASISTPFRFVLAGVAILLGVGPAAAADKIKVVATFSVIGDMVANVAGDRVDLVTLVGPAGDTELFKPSLADGKSVAEAKIVFMNDLNDEFEPWLEPLLKQRQVRRHQNRRQQGRENLHLQRGARPAEQSRPKRSTSMRGSTRRTVSSTSGTSPPPWPRAIRPTPRTIARGRPPTSRNCRISTPGRKPRWPRVPPAKRRILASHDSLQYLAKAYGITLLSINGWTNNSEPSAAELARLTQQIRQEGIHALFLDSITDPRAMQQVAKETGAAIGGTLYGDALSKPGGEADTYLKMLRHDVTTLKAGMMKN